MATSKTEVGPVVILRGYVVRSVKTSYSLVCLVNCLDALRLLAKRTKSHKSAPTGMACSSRYARHCMCNDVPLEDAGRLTLLLSIRAV